MAQAKCMLEVYYRPVEPYRTIAHRVCLSQLQYNFETHTASPDTNTKQKHTWLVGQTWASNHRSAMSASGRFTLRSYLSLVSVCQYW